MKKLLLIFVLVLSAQVTFAQLYSTAEKQYYSQKVVCSHASSLEANVVVAKSRNQQVHHTFATVSSQPRLIVNAWKGEVREVGATLNNDVPAVRRSGGFGNDNFPADPAVPIGDIPWVFLLLCVGGYILSRRKKQSI